MAKDSLAGSLLHHHHAAPRSAPSNARAAPPPRSPSPVILPKPKQVVTSKAVLDSVADRPRTHLGDVVYEPVLKRARLQDPRTGRPPRSGYKSTPKPLPWDLIEGKENCTLTMKIGKEHLTPAAREEITSRRALWGTDVYTDDSDVIAACIHAGWIRGEWPEDVDVSMLGLDEGYSVSDVPQLLSARGNAAAKDAAKQAQSAPSPLTVLTEPPKSGPMPVPPNRDLHVTLLVLPRLEKYASTTRFGIRSREFGGVVGAAGEPGEPRQRAVHDGISFMVIGLRWVTHGAALQGRLRGKARRERMRKVLAEVEKIPAWITGRMPQDAVRNENEQRDGSLGWWKQGVSKPPSEGDKENLNRRETPLQEQQQESQQGGEIDGGKEQVHQRDGDEPAVTESVAREDEVSAAGKEPQETPAAAVVAEKESPVVPAGNSASEKGMEGLRMEATELDKEAEALETEKTAEA